MNKEPATQKIRIGNCLSYIVDNRGKTPPLCESGHELIEVNAIGGTERSVDYSAIKKYVSEDTFKNWFRKGHPEVGDTLISTVGAIGRVAFFMRQRGCIAQNVIAMRPDREVVDPEFFYYLLKSPAVQDRIQSLNIGVAQPSLKVPHLLDYEIEILQRERQGEASRILSAYDDHIENNTRRIEILDEMARRLYEEWFVHFRFPGHEDVSFKESELGDIPEGWECSPLKEFIELAYGKALKKSERKPGPYPVYGSSGEVGTHSEPLVRGPGIILGRKGNVGSVFWTEDDFYPIDTVYFVKTNLPLEYVFFNLQRQRFLNNDAAVPGLNRNQAYSLPFLKPSETVLEQFSSHCKPIYELVRKLYRKNNNLRAQRDLLLPKLVSGEIDVSDIPMPDDKEVEAA